MPEPLTLTLNQLIDVAQIYCDPDQNPPLKPLANALYEAARSGVISQDGFADIIREIIEATLIRGVSSP